jgi:hypothetical protein
MQLDNIFLWSPIRVYTINGFIELSSTFVYGIYVIGIATIMAAIWYFMRKGFVISASVKSAVITSFFVTGILYAIQSEWVWQRWVTGDISKYYSKSIKDHDNLSILDNDTYKLSLEVKKIISDSDYCLYSDYSKNANIEYIAKKLQYHLLPSRKRVSAKFIIVIFDGRVSYNPVTNIFTDINKNTIPAEMCLMMHNNVYILRTLL